MIFKYKKRYYFIVLGLILFLIDQFSKYLIHINNHLLLNKNFILFTLDKVKNYGAAFNIFSGSRILLSTISFVFSLLLIYLILRKNNTKLIDLYSYSLLLGGTLGNGIDRILKGYVIDFININLINFPIFNIADIYINIGFILILISLLRSKK